MSVRVVGGGSGAAPRAGDTAKIADGLSAVLDRPGTHAGESDLTSAVGLIGLTIPQCAYASVTLLDERQRPHTVAATHPEARELDEKQYRLGAGPCLDAAMRRTVNRSGMRDTTQRWPEFVAMTTREGIGGYLAAGLRLPEGSAGGLNLYGHDEGVFGTLDDSLVGALAEHVASAIDASRSHRAAHTLAVQLQTALRSRPVIDYAIGVLMAQTACGPERAFELLKRASQDNNIKLRDLAAQIVDRYSDDNVPR